MPSAPWTVETNLVLTPPTLPLPAGTSLLEAVMAANPGVTIMQEEWTDGSAYKLLPIIDAVTGRWEVKVHLFNTKDGKRGLTRHSTLFDPEDALLLVPTLIAIELGIGLDDLIKEVKDGKKTKPGRTDTPSPR